MNIIRVASIRLLALLTDEYSDGKPFLSARVNPALYRDVLHIVSLDESERTAILFWSKLSGTVSTQCMYTDDDVCAVRLPDDAWPGYGL